MGANEISNRLHAAVKVSSNGTILARTAVIASVVRTGLGLYTVTLSEPIADISAGAGAAAAAYDVACDLGNGLPPGDTGYVNVEQTSSTVFSVSTFDATAAIADVAFCLRIWRMLSAA